jgi:hypothetical protein
MAKDIYQQGDIVGNNKIIKKDIEQTKLKHRGYWICECIQCGNIRSLRTDCLNRNSSCKQCSKIGKNIQDDITGHTFGFWKVLSKANKSNYWTCKCLNCGTIKDVFRGNLTSGNTKSCGCISSWGETQIIYWLNFFNINYKKEYTFKNLKTAKNGIPRFDFAIFDNHNEIFCLIEYDGRQHNHYDKNWKMTYEDYLYLCEIDNLKNQYCIDNNIKLFRFNENTNLEFKIQQIATDLAFLELTEEKATNE